MRIGLVASMDIANANYRAYPLGELSARGHDVILNGDLGKVDRDVLFGCDVVHLYRLCTPQAQGLVRGLRDAGVAIVWDVDDDLSLAPDTVPDRVKRGGAYEQRELSHAVAMARLADVVTTTNEAIAPYYRGHGVECVRVVENYLPDTWAPVAPSRRDDAVVVGWVAAAEHRHELERLRLRERLARVLDANPEVRVHAIGVDVGLDSDRYVHEARVPYEELATRVAGFGVGIAPLDDTPFNRARSNVKLKEYAAAGVPWLASPTGPYAGLGEREGGRLVPDDGWEAAIERLVRKPRERRKLAKRAQAWGRTQTAARNLDAWEAPLLEAVERARRREPAPRGRSAAR